MSIRRNVEKQYTPFNVFFEYISFGCFDYFKGVGLNRERDTTVIGTKKAF